MNTILVGEHIERTPFTLIERFQHLPNIVELDYLRFWFLLTLLIVGGLTIGIIYFSLKTLNKHTKLSRYTGKLLAFIWIVVLFILMHTFLPKDNYDLYLPDNQKIYVMYEVPETREHYVKDSDTLYKLNGWRLEEVYETVLITSED